MVYTLAWIPTEIWITLPLEAKKFLLNERKFKWSLSLSTFKHVYGIQCYVA